MEAILQALQTGSYAYLLIAQILIVTGLGLTLIWFLLKRTQQSALAGPIDFDEMDEMSEKPKEPTVAASDPAEVTMLKAKISAMETEHQGISEINDQLENLKNYNKELNTQLGEYEILQEEIGELTRIKEENARLREELEGPSEISSTDSDEPTQNVKEPKNSIVPEEIQTKRKEETVSGFENVVSNVTPEIKDLLDQIEDMPASKDSSNPLKSTSTKK